MVSLQPQLMLPSHGVAVDDPQLIQKDLTVTADALEYIYNETVEGLNAGLRRDQIFQSIELPEKFKKEPVLQPKYVSAKDISKMIMKQYGGWWNDIPSDWSPAPLELQAEEIVKLSGGIDKLVEHTKMLADENLALAANFADWAFLSDPDDPEVQQLVMDIYRRRILSPNTYTQEKLVYLDRMADVRARMK
jgi:alkyl sulfatase BDS1-like metallo-beta-lactamase superfamily hydrolase